LLRTGPTRLTLLLSGFQPLPALAPAALGAGCAVAPVPGLQSLITAFVAWRLGLNLPLALLMSNLSFGPLLPMWAALSCAVGMWLRLGEPPWRSWPALSADLVAHHQSMSSLLALGQRFFLDWLLGSLVVVPVVMVVAGLAAFAASSLLSRGRARP
jgi:uncharacterized protein (DUF2062 family)